jgi:hypothetical protein
MTEIQTLRPAILVALSTQIKGNRRYVTTELEGEHETADGELRARWETLRVVEDPAEHEAAWLTQRKARGAILRVCRRTNFGLMCREDEFDELLSGMAEAQRLADEFNRSAKITHLSINVLPARIAQDDVIAVRAISADIRSLMDDMAVGVQTLDVKAVRDAAGKLRDVSSMLSDDAKKRIGVAVDAARSVARQIVKAGEDVAVEIDAVVIEKIATARTSFLDLDAPAEVATPAANAARVLDLPDEDEESERS